MKKLTKLKIRYITKIYNVFCEHRSIEEIHKEIKRSTFKDFYVPLEFKKVFFQATLQIKKLVDEGVVDEGETITCVVTGHLLKDPNTAIDACTQPTQVDADIDTLRSILMNK